MAFGKLWPALLKLGCLVLLIVAANFATGWVVDTLNFEIRPSNEALVHKAIVISAIAYTLSMAIPFVPGIEIGLTLIGVLGPSIVFLVYVCTLLGIVFSFLLGRLIPLRYLVAFLEGLGLHKSSVLLRKFASIPVQERLSYLASNAPNRIVPMLLRHRHIALAIIVNIPGNAIIGGGGGIALIAGISRLYSFPAFVGTIAVAVSPLPIAILLFGDELLPRLVAQSLHHVAPVA